MQPNKRELPIEQQRRLVVGATSPPPNCSMERKSSPGSARLGLRFALPHCGAVAPSAHRTWAVPLISRAIMVDIEHDC
jgi:hypothetical protein